MTYKESNKKKRKERKKISAEDFTPSYLVNEILDKAVQYSPTIFSDYTKTFIDPACGNGNILVEVLLRKLSYTDSIQSVSTLYGCDIFRENIHECIHRILLLTFSDTQSKRTQIKIFLKCLQNIVFVDTRQYKNGSLDYLNQPLFEPFEEIITGSDIIRHILSIRGDYHEI